MTTAAPSAVDRRSAIRGELERTRARTLGLLDLLTADQQRQQVSRLMSPPVWDLAHVGNYEELWLLRALDGREPIDESLDDLYNAFEHPRWQRPSLPLLGPSEAREYLRSVRAQVLDLLAEIDFEDEDRLRRDGYVYAMVVQHEQQHCETLLATQQLMGEAAPPPPATVPTPGAVDAPAGEARLPGGAFLLGTDDRRVSYDNERPQVEIEVEPFALDLTPVTNAAFESFIADGGYERPGLWADEGWRWRNDGGLTAPQFWRPSADGWEVLRFGAWQPVGPREPVQHVCWFEADAFARWAGKRLPTEIEWEYAATWHPDGRKQLYPWGDAAPDTTTANLGQRHAGPAEVGAYPEGANPWGVQQLIGDVWEWTSSDFAPWPGFEAFPYDEYSKVFFGDEYKVLRGGSWAADAAAVRGTFRNWDYPIRRQIFAGFRCARDV